MATVTPVPKLRKHLPKKPGTKYQTAHCIAVHARSQIFARDSAVFDHHVTRRTSSAADGLPLKKNGCDLIMMASHGRRALGRLLLGSQVNEVLAHSKKYRF